MLTETQQKFWQAYKIEENRAPRAKKLLALGAFLDSLITSPPKEWYPWARSIAEQVVDNRLDFVIRRPLFERALFPALLAGYRAQLPGSARWLAGLSDQLLQCPDCRENLPQGESEELGLLRAALRHDPADRRSRLRLSEKLAVRLCYSLHELPSGVLYGMDGASPEECDELEVELVEFCELVSLEGMQDRHAELIGACRFHFRGYRDYLLHREKFASYAEYITLHATERG